MNFMFSHALVWAGILLLNMHIFERTYHKSLWKMPMDPQLDSSKKKGGCLWSLNYRRKMFIFAEVWGGLLHKDGSLHGYYGKLMEVERCCTRKTVLWLCTCMHVPYLECMNLIIEQFSTPQPALLVFSLYFQSAECSHFLILFNETWYS